MRRHTTPNVSQKSEIPAEIATRIAENPNVLESEKTFLKFLTTELKCDSGTFHLLGEDHLLRLVADHGTFPEHVLALIQVIPIGKGMAGIAAESRHPVGACNLQVDESQSIRPMAKDTKLKGTIAIPIVLNDSVKGVVGLGNFSEREFTSEEINLVSALGRMFFT